MVDAYRWMSCRVDEVDVNGKAYCPPFPGNDCQSLGCDLTPTKNMPQPQPNSDPNAGQYLVGRNDNGKVYSLVDNYRGRDFVEKFDVIVGKDPTNGAIIYQNQRLISFPTNASGEVQFRTDIGQVPLADGKREAVRVESKKLYNGGVFVLDCDHLPEGKAVWPSWWLFGGSWPCNGEIDIVEYVNSYGPDTSSNHSTLHTDKKCTQRGVPGISNNGICGTADDKNSQCSPCKGGDNSNCAYTGCGVTVNEIKNSDFNHKGPAGYGFNQNGGGMYICEWIYDSSIKIWFIPRQYVDKYIPKNATSVDTRLFPEPYVTFNPCPGSFKNNKITINTTLCGDWGGNVFDNGGMSGCKAFVADNANKFDKAYFLINSIRVFD
jgi:hypothetical protein